MTSLQKQELIDELHIDPANYFESLLNEICSKQAMESKQIEKMQLELVELLANQLERYTNDESCSIPTEKAQQIFLSICYVLGISLKMLPTMGERMALLNQESLFDIYRSGLVVVKDKMKAAKRLLSQLQKNCLKVRNFAYEDTLKHGIPIFFHDYNYEYEAQETPGSIDYPLRNDRIQVSGIEYIETYLKVLTMENEFCNKFSSMAIQDLLRGYSTEYEEDLINIYEVVFTNVLGLAMRGKSVLGLDISNEDRMFLQARLEKFNGKQLQEKLYAAMEAMCFELELEFVNNKAYYVDTIKSIAVRLEHNLALENLDNVFISIKKETKPVGVEFYDSLQMEDEKLRDIIETLNECTNISEKLLILQTEVKSLNDIEELLADCFDPKEYEEVFRLLSGEELEEMMKRIQQDKHSQEFYGEVQFQEWQKVFLGFYKKVVDNI